MADFIYQIDISRAAGQVLKSLQPMQYRQVAGTILALSENPVPDGSRRLSGNTVYHHIDISEHRIVYRVDKEKIYIAVIGNRNNDEVFKRLAKQNP